MADREEGCSVASGAKVEEAPKVGRMVAERARGVEVRKVGTAVVKLAWVCWEQAAVRPVAQVVVAVTAALVAPSVAAAAVAGSGVGLEATLEVAHEEELRAAAGAWG